MKATLLVAALALPAFAQDGGCATGDVPARLACGQERLRLADARLNAAYEDAMAAARALDAPPLPHADLLRDAQRHWIAFRDAACEAEAARNPGDATRTLVRLECLARLTEGRTGDLLVLR